MTEIHQGSSSSPSTSPSWPNDEDPNANATGLGHGPQPWMAHGWPRRPRREVSGSEGSICWLAGQSGKGTGAAPTPLGSEWPKPAKGVVV
jgi:hypothetical protein